MTQTSDSEALALWTPPRNRGSVRARAPLRLGLGGGGSDVSPFCDTHGGYVLNATIDLYAYAVVELLPEPWLVLEATDQERRQRLDLSSGLPAHSGTDPLPLHLGVYRRIVRNFCGGRPFGVRLTTHSDAPPGSGLGSSSTLVVAMLQAFVEALNIPLGEYEIAHLAYEIERVDLGMAGGKQDQYAACFGGVNFIEFNADDRVLVNPLRIKPWVISELESSLVLFFTGVSRASAEIIDQQVKGVEDGNRGAIDALLSVKQEALHMKEALLKGDFALFVSSMQRSWDSKKRTAQNVSNTVIEDIYAAALGAGARAGKISGAGGGGFMMFFVEPSDKPRLIRALSAFPGHVFNCHFTKSGSQAWRVECEV